MTKVSNKTHVLTGIVIVVAIMFIVTAISAVKFAIPFVVAFLAAVLPVVGMLILGVAGIWFIGFLFNVSTARTSKIDMSKIKSKLKPNINKLKSKLKRN